MSARPVLLAVIGVCVAGAAVALALEVRGSAEAPAAATRAPTSPAPALARPAPVTPAAPREYTKFVSPPGQTIHPTDSSSRIPIPAGGFSQWTGREGTSPGDMEEFAKTAGISLSLALEQHRSTLLEERTRDPAYLEKLLGKPPTGEMLAAIDSQVRALHDTTAQAQVSAREKTISDAAAIAQTRFAEDAYRKAYLEATGLTDAQFERFFADDRPLP